MEGTSQKIDYGDAFMETAIDQWYDEVENYDYNAGASNTWLIHWKGTTKIGCGATDCDNLPDVYYV